MEENIKKNRQIGAAAAFVDARLAAGHVAFPLANLVKETGLSVTAAKNQLRRLGSRVVRVSRLQQFFLIVSPEHRSMGAPPFNGGSMTILTGWGIPIIWHFNRRPAATVPIRKHCK